MNGFAKDPASFKPYFVDSAGRESIQGANRTQRNSLVLQHVAYIIEASPILTERANLPRSQAHDHDEDQGPDSVKKYTAMFKRRVTKGQCFHHPYLGCREFACNFGPVTGDEQPLANWNASLGLMLYDIEFKPDGNHLPGFFDANIRGGVLHCDTLRNGPNNENPIQVYGWDAQEVTV